jgi:hypothetical protein
MHGAEAEAAGLSISLDLLRTQSGPDPEGDRIRDPYFQKPLEREDWVPVSVPQLPRAQLEIKQHQDWKKAAPAESPAWYFPDCALSVP